MYIITALKLREGKRKMLKKEKQVSELKSVKAVTAERENGLRQAG